MAYDQLIFGSHAIRRMFEHRISDVDVRDVLERGDIIEEFELDPHATKRIYFAVCDSRPIHIVTIDDDQLMESQIVTVYEPDLERWEPGFRKRRT